jgi:hypothetical protein
VLFRSEAVAFTRNAGNGPSLVMTSTDLVPIGKWIGRHYPSTHTLGILRMGAIGYYSGLRIIDLYGLCDKFIARHKNDEQAIDAYLTERSPDLLSVIVPASTDQLSSDHDQYGGHYKLVKSFPQGNHQRMGIYERVGTVQ